MTRTEVLWGVGLFAGALLLSPVLAASHVVSMIALRLIAWRCDDVGLADALWLTPRLETRPTDDQVDHVDVWMLQPGSFAAYGYDTVLVRYTCRDGRRLAEVTQLAENEPPRSQADDRRWPFTFGGLAFFVGVTPGLILWALALSFLLSR